MVPPGSRFVHGLIWLLTFSRSQEPSPALVPLGLSVGNTLQMCIKLWILFPHDFRSARWGLLAEPLINEGSALSLSLCLCFGAEFAQFAVCPWCGHGPPWTMRGLRCPNREAAKLFSPKSRHQVISVSNCSSFSLVISCFWHLLHTVFSAASVFLSCC